MDSAGVFEVTFPKLLRRKEVETLVGMGSSTLYRKMDEGSFPRPVDVGGGSVRWREDDLREWLDALPKSQGGWIHDDGE